MQKKCLGKMGDVAQTGRTIVFVRHNITAMRRLTSRAIWLEGGQIADTGPAANLIDHYLQKSAESNLESVWEEGRTAPGDDRVRLHSVRVIPQGNSEGLISVHTPLRIEFTYWNYVPGAVLNVSMILNNLEEVCVLASPSDFRPRPAGPVRHIVSIPGDFLNAGSYYINAMIVKDASVGILLQNNVVAFEVVEGEVVGNWYGRSPGAVRPKLKWESEAIEASDLAPSTARDRST
jgi:lipopolysaccharide transport system ATP-binding protein